MIQLVIVSRTRATRMGGTHNSRIADIDVDKVPIRDGNRAGPGRKGHGLINGQRERAG